jgi:hypothetical protein
MDRKIMKTQLLHVWNDHKWVYGVVAILIVIGYVI